MTLFFRLIGQKENKNIQTKLENYNEIYFGSKKNKKQLMAYFECMKYLLSTQIIQFKKLQWLEWLKKREYLELIGNYL